LEACIPIIRDQWCTGTWRKPPADDEGFVRYCAMGAVQEVLGKTSDQFWGDYGGRVAPIAKRLAKVIKEQHPEWYNNSIQVKNSSLEMHPHGDGYVVEFFNDSPACSRDKMLAVFEMAPAG